MSTTRHFIAVACLAVISACSTVMAPPHSGFLSDYAALVRGNDGAARMPPTAIIDPTRVTIGEIAWRATAGASISDDERRLLTGQLREELAARVGELPAAPQGRPAVLRAAITRVDTVSPALNAVSALVLIVPLDRGGAAVDVEAIDPDTGEQMAALSLGHFAPLSELKAQFNKLAPARLALRKAASEFGALLSSPAAPTAPQRASQN